MKPLVKITENIVDKSVSRLGAIQTHIFLNWKNIAGQYADVTFPDKIKFDKNKKFKFTFLRAKIVPYQRYSHWDFNQKLQHNPN